VPETLSVWKNNIDGSSVRIDGVELSERLSVGMRNRRAELGLTLREVAFEAGMSLPYVANLEKGRGNPTLDVVESLAGALDIPVAELLSSDAGTPGRQTREALPAAVVLYARSQKFRNVTERLARRQRIPVDETRRQVLDAIAAAPRARGRPLSRQDCQRLVDAFTLIINEPPDPV
jgi:transcriptional regulator with XRE-family HTH domain